MINFKDIAKIFETIELKLIASLKRNLQRHKAEELQYGFGYSSWQAEKLRNMERFRRETRAIVNEYVDVIDEQTRQLMKEQFQEGEKLAEQEASAEHTIADNMSIEVSKQPSFFGVNQTKMEALMEDITDLEKTAETAAIRTIDDVYRQTVHKVQLEMATGSTTLTKAIDDAIKDFLDKGINSIVYRDGRRVNIADYVRMAVQTTSTRASLQGKAKRWAELGYDTVLVSQYGGCSKTCEPYQGKVYIDDVFTVWNGERNGDMGKSNYCGKWFPLLSSTIRGGLFHPNCRHTMVRYIDGITKIPEPIPAERIAKQRELERKQRAMEREIRRLKRYASGTLDPTVAKEYRKKLREAQAELKKFIEDTNKAEGKTILNRDYSREKVYGASIIPSETKSTPPVDVPNATEGNSVEVTVSEPEKPQGAYTDEVVTASEKQVDQARASDIFNDYGAPEGQHITADEVYKSLQTSEIGREYLRYAEELAETIQFDYDTEMPGIYGENNGDSIIIYMKSNPTVERVARTVIHECTHHKYGIGESQWAECVCVAHELMHKHNRKELTFTELKSIIKAVKDTYPEYEWRKGGIVNGRRKNH